MVSEELAAVALEGRGVSYTHAVLIETETGWHVEMEDIPADSCPFTESECSISFDTWDGERCTGSVSASYATDDRVNLILTGTEELRRTRRADATEDAGGATAPS